MRLASTNSPTRYSAGDTTLRRAAVNAVAPFRHRGHSPDGSGLIPGRSADDVGMSVGRHFESGEGVLLRSAFGSKAPGAQASSGSFVHGKSSAQVG